jgi:Eco57I restriction-modification methylase
MTNFQDTLDELFSDKLNFQYNGQPLPTPEIDGNENIINYTKEYEGLGTDIILVECNDRIIEFQKKLIKNQKSFFPNAHFLFVSNGGKVFDIYNNSTSKKLKKITYDVIGRNTRLFKEKLQLFNVSNASDGTELQINVEKAFDTSDKVTKKFFDKFKKIHDKLQKAITGIDDDKDKSWYASVMMNRLMFIYFLQKHYVIQNNTDFLLQKFDQVSENGKDYYKDFLLPLFFYGFARRDNHPEKIKFVEEYGSIRYLNGGLFYPHHLEKKYTDNNVAVSVYQENALQTNIGIDAKLLKEILTFLNGYTWYLDNRPMKEDTDINPDVLGYIFEKYINQKELGAYYTKEDITEYISKNTIIPFILDKMKANGFDAPDPNPMITNNEEIIGNIGNYVDTITDYNEIKFLYKDVLLELSVLDPAVGSGAFLFSALNILLPIYQKTVFRLKEFNKTIKDTWLKETMSTINKHAEEYFLTKQIILNNLYGVDIVEEATEICKLRLFLQLASHLPDITSIEPLPDIDFNIYAGNSLVGGLSWEDLEANYMMDLFTSANADNIKADINTLSNLKTKYRTIQQDDDNVDELMVLKDNIITLEYRVNNDINIGIDNPFHWFIDFNKILNKGGFDVIIGNPPYVEYSKVKKQYEIINYDTIKCGNIYANFIERSSKLSSKKGRIGKIVQMSVCCTQRMKPVQAILKKRGVAISNYNWRPAKLFEGSTKANISLSIILDTKNEKTYSTSFLKWNSEERENLFKSFKYNEVKELKYEFIIPKLGNEFDVSIYNKLILLDTIESKVSSKKTNHKLYYRTTGGLYWKIFTDFSPYFKRNGELTNSSRETKLYFKSKEYLQICLALFWSNLYWWWYSTNSNGRDNNPFDLKSFPINPNIFENKELLELSDNLMKNLEKNSVISTRKHKNDITEYQKFIPKKSKHIVDRIDKILQFYYKLTDSERDYIIDYDIKYRLGIENKKED